MPPRDRDDWLRLARMGLETARWAAGEGEKPEVALFHSQQCAEKALKSVIVAGAATPPRTHELSALLAIASASRPVLTARADDALLLTAYGVAARYPHVGDPYTAAEVEAALQAAERVLMAVQDSTS